MKRLTALFLSLVLLVSCCPLIASASSDYSLSQIDVVANGDVYQENVYIRKNEIYMSVDAITRYSLYNNSCGDLFFLRRDQFDYQKAYKWVTYKKEEQTLKVKTGNRIIAIENVDYILQNDVYYLPVHKVLPYMDSTVSVSDGKLIIDSDNISMADAMYGFDNGNYMFNMAEEFADSELLATLYYVIPYLFNTITEFRFDRASIRNINGNTNDYMKAYENIILDSSEYINAVSGDTSTNELLDVSDKLFAGAEAIAGIEKISEEVFDVTYKFGDDYFELVEVCKGLGEIKDGYKYAEFIHKYMNMVDDHSKLLDVVYDGVIKDNLDTFDVQEYRAAQLASAEYSKAAGMLFPVISKAVEKITEKIIDATEVGIYKEVAEALGDVLEVGLGLEYTEEVSLLPYYARIMYSAQDALNDYRINTNTDYDEEAIRLSTILFLLASQKCYKTLAAQCEERLNSLVCLTPKLYKNNLKSYNAKIDQISSRLALLYLAKNSAIVVDSDKLKKELKKVTKREDTKIADIVPAVQQEAKSEWHWLVEPKIEADDIQPVTHMRYVVDSDGEHFNTKGLQVYDIVSKIENNESLGLIACNGLIIAEGGYGDIAYINENKEPYYRLEGKTCYVMNSRNELTKVKSNDDHFNMFPESYLIWVNDLGALFDGQLPEVSKKVTYNDVIAVPYIKTSIKYGDPQCFDVDNISGCVLLNKGKPVNSSVYDDFGVYSCGVIPMKKSGKWGYINESGKTVLPFEFDGCINNGIGIEAAPKPYNASGDYIAVCKNGKYALYNTSGALVVDYDTFEQIRPVYNGMFWAKKDGKWGVVELVGYSNSFKASEPKESLESEVEAVVNEKSGLRLREKASTDCKVLGMLSNKSKVYICGATEEWAYIRVDNAYGYVKMKYLLYSSSEQGVNQKVVLDKKSASKLFDEASTIYDRFVCGYYDLNFDDTYVDPNGAWYSLVTDKRMDTLEHLKNTLNTYFDSNISKELLAEEDSIFIERNGKIYWNSGGRGSDQFIVNTKYSLKSATMKDAVFTVTVEYDYDFDNTVDERKPFNYPIKRINGKWVFTDFPVYW